MAVTAQMVKELRERTNAGMMDCKKALLESDGDMDKAIDWLREKGLAQAAKKASRIAAEGVVAQYVTPCGCTGVIAEVNCETDFVAKTDNFMNFANNVAKHIAKANYDVGRLDGIDEGFEKGLAEGVEKGVEKGRREIIQAMHAQGIDVEQIAVLTGIASDEVARISAGQTNQ